MHIKSNHTFKRLYEYLNKKLRYRDLVSGLINLHYEIRICQKTYNRVTMTVYVKCVVWFNVHKTLHVRGQWKYKNSCSWAGMSYSAVAPRRHSGGLSYANVCTRGWPQRWCFSPVCVEVEQMLWLKHSKAWWLVWPQFLSLKELSWYSQVFSFYGQNSFSEKLCYQQSWKFKNQAQQLLYKLITSVFSISNFFYLQNFSWKEICLWFTCANVALGLPKIPFSE